MRRVAQESWIAWLVSRPAQYPPTPTMRKQTSQFAAIARHLIVTMVVTGLLSVPATCAQAAGPHSMYLPPNSLALVASASAPAAGPVVPMHAQIPDRLHAGPAAHDPSLHDRTGAGPALPALPAGLELPDADGETSPAHQLAVRELPSPAMMALALAASLPAEQGVVLPAQDVSPIHHVDMMRGRSIAPVSPPPR